MKSNHYTHSLYYKLLIGYLIFGLLGFITIATISSEMTYHHLVERESEVLYDEATMIADRCSKAYEGKTINLDSAYPQLEAVSAYLQSDIWILNHEGTIVASQSTISTRPHRATGSIPSDSITTCLTAKYSPFPPRSQAI